MAKTCNKLIILTLIILTIFSFTHTHIIHAQVPIDIQNHWTQDYIITLLNKDIMKTNQSGLFKPDTVISRGEYAAALARQQTILPIEKNNFNDLKKYPEKGLINALVEKNIMSGYPDNTFRPNQAISRAEAITSIIKLLGIVEDKAMIQLNNYNPFQDISNKHWAANYIKIADKLGLFIKTPEKMFYPGRSITKAEAAKFISSLNHISSQTGYITDVFPTSKKISVNLLEGERKIYSFTNSTLIGRNNRIVNMKEILKTDKVFIITKNNEAKYIKAYGMVTKQDLSTEVSKMTQGILSSDDIEELAKGNLNILEPKLINTIKEQLVAEGLTDKEIQAIMNTEWNKLEELSKSRLSEAISIQTGLPLVITRGLLNGDWEQIKTYAQIEVVQRVIQQLISSQLIS